MTGALMLTAWDDRAGEVLDLTALSDERLHQLHGKPNRLKHGVAPLCRHCDWPVHFVKRGETMFWRHDPGNKRACLTADVRVGESAEHIAAKVAIVVNLRLRKWDAKLEEAFPATGRPEVVVDVYAQHPHPRAHQVSTAWEVQLSRQTHGDFIERTAQRERFAQVPTTWVTPHRDALGDLQGLVSDTTGGHIIERLWQDHEGTPYPAMALGKVVGSLAARTPKLRLLQIGENGTWVALNADDISGRPATKKPARRARERDDADTCWRVGLPQPEQQAAFSVPAGPSPVHIRRPSKTWPVATVIQPSGRTIRCSHSLLGRRPDGVVRCSYCGAVVEEQQ